MIVDRMSIPIESLCELARMITIPTRIIFPKQIGNYNLNWNTMRDYKIIISVRKQNGSQK